MFSEYASRFLAQSGTQSRLSVGGGGVGGGGQQDASSSTRNPRSRRSNMPGPYQQSPSRLSRFPFASRATAPPAPLFFSTTDEFRDQDDGEEHEREVADFYALQRSRRAFGPSHLTESSELDEEGVEHESQVDADQESDARLGLGRGIRSSWRGDRKSRRGRTIATEADAITERPEGEQSTPESERSSSKGKGKLVDVELSSSESSSVENLDLKRDKTHEEGHDDDHDDDDDDDDETKAREYEQPPAYLQFRTAPAPTGLGTRDQPNWLPQETDESTAQLYPGPTDIEQDSVYPGTSEDIPEQQPRHDQFWSSLFTICFASLFASALLVYLHTDSPIDGNPLGDTIYATLHASFHLLAVYTLVASFVAAVWLALLRNFLRPLTYLMLIAMPVILFSFSLWPFIVSFNGAWHGRSFQDRAMRTFAFIPFVGCIVWTYLAIKSRHSLNRAIDILEFATRILSASPALVLAGFAALIATIAWFWIWLLMFTRVFLEGHWAMKLFIIDTSSWWLAIFFVLMLLWTQSIISGIQRATTAATVSQWYFHRQTVPAPSSRAVVSASFLHATGPLFGSICLSTLSSLLVRLPLILLPGRIVGFFSLCFYALTPAPLAALTNPLTLTYAAIHSQPLAVAARGLTRLPLNPTPSRSFSSGRDQDPMLPYRTTHLLLHTTRQIMTLALGLGAWVASARLVHLGGAGYAGSLYAYVVGLGAAIVGWGILGAVEGIVGGVVDGVVVCWGSEVAAGKKGRGFCWEAGELFGDDRRGGGIEV